MSSDEWRKFLTENFKDEGDVALNLEELTVQQIHGFLGIAERRLLAYATEQGHKGMMTRIVIWRLDKIRRQLKQARNSLGAVIGFETWLTNALESARNGETREDILKRLEEEEKEG
jgi:AraC-like DNA-binding protein